MRGCSRNDGLGLSKGAIDVFEPPQKTPDSPRAHRDMPGHFYIILAYVSRDDRDLFLRARVLHPEQLFGQQLTKPSVHLKDALHTGLFTRQATLINPLLDGNMGRRLTLEMTLLGIGAKLFVQST